MKFKFINAITFSPMVIGIIVVVVISIIIGIMAAAKVGPFADKTEPTSKQTIPPTLAPVVGTMARYIKITQPNAVYMTLGWLEAYAGAYGTTNIALNKPVTKSWAQGRYASNVTNINNGDNTLFFHSNSNPAGNWFMIDLGAMYDVSSIKLYFTSNPTVGSTCVSRMLGLVLTLLDESNTVVYTANPTMDASGKSILPADCGASTAYKSYTFSPPSKIPVGK
jgi:hypothetical protein